MAFTRRLCNTFPEFRKSVKTLRFLSRSSHSRQILVISAARIGLTPMIKTGIEN